MTANLTFRALAGLACLLGLAAPSVADDPKADSYDPGARELLGEVARAYQALPGYADHGQLNFLAKSGDDEKKGSSPRTVTFARPNKLVLDYGVLQLISDGKDLTASVVPTKKYAVSPAPELLTTRNLARAPIPGIPAPQVLIGIDGLPITILLDLLAGTDPVSAVLEGTDGLKLEPDRERDGKTVQSMLLDQTQGPDIRMLVDPKSKLLAAIDLVFNLNEMNANITGGPKIDELSISWTPGEVTPRAPEDAFAYHPPADFEKFDPKDGPAGPGTEQSAVEALVGKPAPNFVLSVLDGEGHTKTLTNADLLGKVVLIDFWATWCGPCLMELPEIQKIAEAYADKEVVIVAVSQDDDPTDKADLRKLVETTLDAKKITLAASPIGKVALDPDHTVGNAFQVEGLPTVVLLDPKGVVQAAHVGFSPQVFEILSKDLDSLLEGKSLVEAKAKD